MNDNDAPIDETSFADGEQWGSMYKSATECADGDDITDKPGKRGKDEDEIKTEPKGLALTTRYLYRRAHGESKLFDILGTEPLQYGTASHALAKQARSPTSSVTTTR